MEETRIVPPPPFASRVEIAGFWRRLAAFVLDGLFLGLLGTVIGFFFFDALAALGLWGRLIGGPIMLGYFGVLDSNLAAGQSLGKRLLGIRVVDGHGIAVTPIRASARCLVILLALGFNQVPLPPGWAAWILLPLQSLVVLGVGVALIYLYLFNRRTRQSLHDLLMGTYVVRLSSSAPEGIRVWRGHLAIVGLWMTVTLAMPLVFMSFKEKAPFRDETHLREDLTRKLGTENVSVLEGKTTFWGEGGTTETSFLKVGADVKMRPEAFDSLVDEVAALVLAKYPKIESKDQLTISLRYGYDILISSRTVGLDVSYSPTEWTRRLSSSKLEVRSDPEHTP